MSGGTVIPPPTTPDTFPLGPWRRELIYVVDESGNPEEGLGVSAHSSLDFTGGSDSSITAQMIPPGVGGDDWTIETVGDSGVGQGVTLELDIPGKAITVHFEDGVSTDEDVVDAFYADDRFDDLLYVKFGSVFPAWTIADNEFGPTNLAGGADSTAVVYLLKPASEDKSSKTTNLGVDRWLKIGGASALSELDYCHVTRPIGGPSGEGWYVLWLTGSHVNIAGQHAVRLPVGSTPDNPVVETSAKFEVEATIDSASIADAVWDEVGGDHVTASTFGKFLNDLVSRLTSARAGYIDNLNVGGPVDEQTRAEIFSWPYRTGRTLAGLARRIDSLFFNVVTGLRGSHVVGRAPGGVDVEFEVDQDRAAGSRSQADVTGSEED